jgi:hypothetical protein
MKGLFTTFIILIYSELTRKYKPFKLKKFNILDYYSSIILCVSFTLGVFNNKNPNNYLIYIAWVIFAFANALYTYLLI